MNIAQMDIRTDGQDDSFIPPPKLCGCGVNKDCQLNTSLYNKILTIRQKWIKNRYIHSNSRRKS